MFQVSSEPVYRGGLTGSWIPVAMHRRPLMVLFHSIYKFLPGDGRDVVPLPRRAAEDLLLAAVFAPLAWTNTRAEVQPVAWAMDASPTAGAFGFTSVPKEVAEELWLHGE